MRRANALACLLWMLLASSGASAQQNRNFIAVEGATLAAKFDAAARQAASGAQSRYWTAYSFDVRPGVAVDFEYVGDDGSYFNFSGDSVSFSDGVAVAAGGVVETRNLGVFVLRTREGNSVVRVDVYNLQRRREYSGYPVYWAGRAANDESLTMLRGMVDSATSSDLAGQAARAVALHDDRRVGEMLESIARNAKFDDARASAVSWLGRTPDPTPARQAFLLDLARSEREPEKIRRAAIHAYGAQHDASSMPGLRGLFTSVTTQDLRRAVLASVARNESRDAVDFLLNIARSDADADMRKRALMHLGHRAGQQSLGAIAGATGQPDAETELQKQAVHALSRRPADESVPLLLNIARTHRKPEVRREALRLLGRTGDARALDLFREILSR
ncbi:MAG TPA: HEAT repeat domain-containing protein [Pyrinomonadaceae bacterium]|nr:HEAT repeat domain-containing protein [Pyrinomonadaceae bacterium]